MPCWMVPHPPRLLHPQALLLPPLYTTATLWAVATRTKHYGNRASVHPPLVSVALLWLVRTKTLYLEVHIITFIKICKKHYLCWKHYLINVLCLLVFIHFTIHFSFFLWRQFDWQFRQWGPEWLQFYATYIFPTVPIILLLSCFKSSSKTF